ncbi:ARM repeat-containing protein [Lentinus tigrinus ALCF2SS1-7]|uniref:Nucleolar protein 9 n=1 Tax=Lentinus tigrinus ALCF2SS1-6 TaxID=1328759 RepID=A0A5C2SE28_9APHY|nr:ARM repeat-containing protein [Lentinus tigrinus ALCF2SS1-6]RPD74528.1 ARM repeat-containing protein [Lentinus tigrinus ALCF2SS1-7]
MPRENRKRGKKHKKKPEEETYAQAEEHPPQYEEDQAEAAGPSWIVPAREDSSVDLNAPFGYVDAEVKAYFRTVDVQIREWQETRPEVEADEDVDPNEDRRLFFVAALQEMSEKEKQLATDPDCSTILERMIHSMDDFVRRVFMDRLTGSLEQLSKHRFASHVIQTLLTVASETVSRESRGVFPPSPESGEDEGELPTMTQLILDACEELSPSICSLIMDPFASHVVRALFLLLAPDVLGSLNDTPGKSATAVRSKKSAAYKARQGSMKSVFTDSQADGHSKAFRSTPKEFRKAAIGFVNALREQLGENEVRALAANQVASPVLQMLLELEAAYGQADQPGSLMDHALVGMITASHEGPNAEVPESDYLTTLLRDPTASHLLETLVSRSPGSAFDNLWRTYFSGKLPKLAVHPVANFVVAKGIERLSVEQLASTIDELRGVASKIVKNARTGVLRALVDRSTVLQSGGHDVVQLILDAFELGAEDKKALLVPCVLRLKSSQQLQDYQRALASAGQDEEKDAEEPHHKRRKTDDPLEPKTQGAVLLQSMLRLPSPHNDIVLDSLHALSLDELTEMAHHPTSSRVLDAVLESPSVPYKAKRKFVMTFIGHYHVLVDDRIGSRVGDRCWAFADPYLKEKIARSLVPHEHTLAGSFYGKFFARNLNLHVLQRDPERWKSMQAAAKAPAVDPAAVPAAPTQKNGSAAETSPKKPSESDRSDKAKHKKGKGKQDEIDALFDATLGKKVKKAELSTSTPEAKPSKEDTGTPAKSKSDKGEKKSKKRKDRDEGGTDRDLTDVLGAIRSAPKEDKGPKKRKKAH